MESRESILKLYKDFVSLSMENTPPYSEMLSSYNEIREELNSTLTEEQKQKLEVLEKLQDDMNEEEDKQAFVEGFSLATRLLLEALC